MFRDLSATKSRLARILALVLVAAAFFTGACKSDESGPTTPTPVIDDDGDTLSQTTTGIKLPKSVQTIPSENTAARLLRLNKGGGE